MASREERYKAYLRSEEQKTLQEQQLKQQIKATEVNRRQEVARRVADGLGLQAQLQEIRDTIWKEGTVQSEENTDFSKYFLEASWPAFRIFQSPATESAWGGSEASEYTKIISNKVSLEIRLQACDDIYHIGLDGKWDGKSIEVLFRDVKRSDVIDISQPITQWTLDRIETYINENLAYINKRYPFPLAIARNNDRQEIIDKVLSGKLERSKVPADFGYEFPPEPKKTHEPVARPQEKRFSFREFFKKH